VVRLEDAVLEELRAVLFDRQDVVAALAERRVAEARALQASTKSTKSDARAQVARLEAEVRNLVAAVARGESADLAAGVNERRSRIETLRAALDAPEPAAFDKARFLVALAGLRSPGGRPAPAPHLGPGRVRETMEALGVRKIVVSRAPDGSVEFSADADLSGFCGSIYSGATAVSSEPTGSP
jgi:hypothetical protein